jgi:protein-disulfide isomerase
MRAYTRRDALRSGAAVAGLGGLAGLAGCLGGSGAGAGTGDDGSGDAGDAGGSEDSADSEDSEDSSGSGDADGTGGAGDATDAGSSGAGDGSGVDASYFGGHPATTGIGDEPVLGTLGEATATVVAFEDPSCPTCRRFERNAGARIREELVPAGDVAFVARSIPIIYAWGKPAVQALEATYARDAGAFWDLFDHYFAAQDQFFEAGVDEVLPRTERWLADETDLDAAAVVADAEAAAYDGAVTEDLDAADAAGVSRTPTLFLFRGGEFRTEASGSVSFDLVTSALEL